MVPKSMMPKSSRASSGITSANSTTDAPDSPRYRRPFVVAASAMEPESGRHDHEQAETKLRSFLGGRYPQRHAGGVDPAVDGDAAVVGLGDGGHDGQPEPRGPAVVARGRPRRTGRHERFEDAISDRGIDAGT